MLRRDRQRAWCALSLAILGLAPAGGASADAASERNPHSRIGPGHELYVERTAEGRRDWNTGSSVVDYTHTVILHGHRLDDDALLALIHKTGGPEAAQLAYVTVWDAKPMAAPDDVAVMVSISSQGEYRVIRLRLVAGEVQTTVLGEPRPAENWFLDSRTPAAIAWQGPQALVFMDTSSGALTSLGEGVLADVRGDTALMVRRGEAQGVSAIDLRSGTERARLALSSDCFHLPAFEFDHPRLYEHMQSSTDTVVFRDGPRWLASIVDYVETPAPKLSLRSDHGLKPPEAAGIAIEIPEVDRGPQPRTPEEVAGGGVAMPPRIGVDPGDEVVLRRRADCAAVNPAPAPVPAGRLVASEAVSALDFCLEDDLPVRQEDRALRCGAVHREMAAPGTIRWQRTRFDYRREGKAPAIPLVSEELGMGSKMYSHLESAQNGEAARITEVVPLAANDLLLTARGSGAYTLYRAHLVGGKPRLESLEGLAYPKSPADVVEGGRWIYFRSDGILVRRDPFAVLRVEHLLTIEDGQVVTWGVSSGYEELSLALTPLAALEDGSGDASKATLVLPQACRRADDPFWEFAVPPVDATLAQSSRWLHDNFLVDAGHAKLYLRSDHRLRIDARCRPQLQALMQSP